MNSSPTPLPPVIVPRSEHSISRADISPNALKVLYRLKEAGYQGFLVGGAVRDLLLGLRPKDFDVATDALPEEVRRLFRNCRLIGRRFRLAHVFFGNEIIEVATFRAAAAPEREDAEDLDAEGGSDAGTEGGADGAESRVDEPAEFSPPADSEHRAFDTRGRILRDNIYGTIEEDVWRRDFAANGLYYNIEDFSIWDFVDGVNDVKARRLTMIGDPETRYREDPVRMLRAVRFAAKLDFSIEPNTEAPIKRLAYMLDGVPPARLFDEVLKLFLSGFGEKAYELLQRYGLFEHLFPQSAAAFAMPPYAYAADMLKMGLENTDARIAADKPVTPTFLFAVLLWSAVLRELNERQAGPTPDIALLMQACESVLRTQQSRVSIPRRFSIPMRELLMLQPRFNRRSGVKSLSLLQHPRFRAAYDFLLLRAQAGVADPELAKWWTDIQVLPQEERVALVQARPPEPAAEGAPAPGRRRRRRRRGGAARS
ncbi:MAG TPA: polynucleotide adenylyltransferase PcnB [Steroidobacteraceae bacterium]|nr:polynucleotide adenylyltransferase PcnB [Steroidobacteraceae bacterium]